MNFLVGYIQSNSNKINDSSKFIFLLWEVTFLRMDFISYVNIVLVLFVSFIYLLNFPYTCSVNSTEKFGLENRIISLL